MGHRLITQFICVVEARAQSHSRNSTKTVNFAVQRFKSKSIKISTPRVAMHLHKPNCVI